MTGKDWRPGRMITPPAGGGSITMPPKEEADILSPSPMSMVMDETETAKKKVKGRRRGRTSTILAGRLMSEHGKKLLGE